jgi:hypothetical protein
MKNLLFCTIIAFIILVSSCKKDSDSPTPAGTTSFTFNGTTYSTIKCNFTSGSNSGGVSIYSTLADSAVNSDGSKAIYFGMIFNKTGRPVSGDYYVYGDTGLPNNTPNLVTLLIFEYNKSTNRVIGYEVPVSPSQSAVINDNGKISVTLPDMTMQRQEYDSNLNPVGSSSSVTFSRTTFTEQ